MIKEIRLCDICLTGDKPKETDASVTRRFGQDSTEYEIDVCPKHASAMEKTFSVFIAHARRAPKRGYTSQPAPKRDRARSRDIRTWADQRGLTVNSHGRIPEHVLKEYDLAHAS